MRFYPNRIDSRFLIQQGQGRDEVFPLSNLAQAISLLDPFGQRLVNAISSLRNHEPNHQQEVEIIT